MKKLNKELLNAILSILIHISFLILFGLTIYDHAVLNIQPSNFRILIVLILCIQTYKK